MSACVVLGFILRITYCIKYEIQPRDAYTYEHIIYTWAESNEIKEELSYFPFSLWIIKKMYQLSGSDIMKIGVAFNLYIGLLIIVLTCNTIRLYTSRPLIQLFGGLTAATHPVLIKYSCSLLRENCYLLFVCLFLLNLIKYYREKKEIHVFLAGLCGAFSLLCKLEGTETIFVFFSCVCFLLCCKKIRFKAALLHNLIFALTLVLTCGVAVFLLGMKIPSANSVISKFDLVFL